MRVGIINNNIDKRNNLSFKENPKQLYSTTLGLFMDNLDKKHLKGITFLDGHKEAINEVIIKINQSLAQFNLDILKTAPLRLDQDSNFLTLAKSLFKTIDKEPFVSDLDVRDKTIGVRIKGILNGFEGKSEISFSDNFDGTHKYCDLRLNLEKEGIININRFNESTTLVGHHCVREDDAIFRLYSSQIFKGNNFLATSIRPVDFEHYSKFFQENPHFRKLFVGDKDINKIIESGWRISGPKSSDGFYLEKTMGITAKITPEELENFKKDDPGFPREYKTHSDNLQVTKLNFDNKHEIDANLSLCLDNELNCLMIGKIENW